MNNSKWVLCINMKSRQSPILAHILESFAREILENQESQPLESETQLKESGIQVPLIKDRESSTWNYRIQRLESRM